jgi:hypothetical protein
MRCGDAKRTLKLPTRSTTRARAITPVKWATHNGGHTDVPTDPGQSKAWTIDLTWKWLTQF